MNYTENVGADSSGLRFYDSTEGWQSWFESRLAQEREQTIALLTEVVRDLLHDLDKAIVDVRFAAKPQDGRDGRGLNVCGTWDPKREIFRARHGCA
jgi:hypothetical protein